jgi:hypothetical protein
MPFYTYQCQDCQRSFKLLVKDSNLAPNRCGRHCVLSAGENDAIRGMGKLNRSFQDIGGIRFNTEQRATESGLSTYKKDVDGVFRKVAGPQNKGPETIDPDNH